MKKILFLLLAASANSWAVDMNPEDYGERVEDFGLKGPVKSYSAVSRNKSLYLAFNKDGLLTQGKATNVEGTASTLTTDFDIVGNIVRRTHTDFSLKCPECEKLTEEYKQLAADADVTTDYNKCKNNADFAKKQIKCNTTFEYNNKGELAKKVETKAVNEYEPFTTLYRYDEEGRKTGERHYRGNADNNKNSSDKWDDTWVYENGRLIKDNDYTYKYNKLGQLAEKSYKGDPNNKYVFTYLPSGKLKKRVYGNRKDTIVCNTNGDTVLYAHKSYFQYHRPDGEIERRIMPFTTSREITKYSLIIIFVVVIIVFVLILIKNLCDNKIEGLAYSIIYLFPLSYSFTTLSVKLFPSSSVTFMRYCPGARPWMSKLSNPWLCERTRRPCRS